MQYVALLRGINVGGNNKVPMADLKDCIKSLGYSDVSTYINSGNVLFTTKKTSETVLANKIEVALEKQFGFPIQTVVRSAKNIQAVVDAIPVKWKNDANQKTDVLFLTDDFKQPATLKLIETKAGIDTLMYVSGAIIWHIMRKDYTKSSLRTFIGTAVYKNMTARNVNTVLKIAALLKT